MIYLELFFEFFKAGLFALGGGMVTVPFLYEMATTKGWFTVNELINMIAISESTPGPIGINMATYVGYATTGNVLGGIVATLGETAPSIISILIIAAFLNKFKDNYYVGKVFEIIRPATLGAIVSVLIGIILSAVFKIDVFNSTGNYLDLFDIKYISIFVIILILNFKFKKLHPLVFILIAAALGIILSI